MLTMNYKRGEIVLVLFPDSNLRTAKRRPALVVQANKLDTALSQTIIAMITSNLDRKTHPSRVFVSVKTEEGQQAGLLMDSVIMTDNLTTVLHTEIDKSIGVWRKMRLVDKALRYTLGL